jgi:hypothetical protein
MPPPTAASSGRWLKRNTPPHNKVLYNLELSLSASNLRPSNVSVWKIEETLGGSGGDWKVRKHGRATIECYEDFTGVDSKTMHGELTHHFSALPSPGSTLLACS